MASTSNPRNSHNDGGHTRMKNAASTIYSENQSLISEIRKFMTVMKGIAVDLEKDKQSEMVKKLEDGVTELLASSDDCSNFSSAIQAVGDGYTVVEGEESTDFKKLFEDEVAKLKAGSSSNPQTHPLLRQFKEAIWHVHHAGQPMPGEEQEDIVMTSTESNILNNTCPLSGKPVIELAEPVRSKDCKHIYEKEFLVHYVKSKSARNTNPVCPVAGCPKILQAGRVVCDPLLLIEIDELRSVTKQNAQPNMVEDFTELDDD